MSPRQGGQSSIGPRRAIYTLATIWIFGVALFYYARFTFLAYATHQTRIDARSNAVY